MNVRAAHFAFPATSNDQAVRHQALPIRSSRLVVLAQACSSPGLGMGWLTPWGNMFHTHSRPWSFAVPGEAPRSFFGMKSMPANHLGMLFLHAYLLFIIIVQVLPKAFGAGPSCFPPWPWPACSVLVPIDDVMAYFACTTHHHPLPSPPHYHHHHTTITTTLLWYVPRRSH